MSNETETDKKAAAPVVAAQDPKLTRIKVKHLYFSDNLDIQGKSQESNLKCYRDPENAPNYYTCDFIPAWQAFEITWHRHQTAPEVRIMPALHVRTWVKA